MSGIMIKKTTIDIPRLRKKSKLAFNKAQKKAGIQFLTWCNAGSPNDSSTPPIRWGILRGSSSVFVDNELVYIYPQTITSGSNETISPARSYDGKDGSITIVYNTDYAFKMHEERGKSWENLGPFSVQARNAVRS